MVLHYPELAERCELIKTKLDQMMPVPVRASTYAQEGVERERQRIAARAGWNRMPLAELRLAIRVEQKAPV